jgi:hypothetical protein
MNPATPHSAESWISGRRSLWERRLDRLGDYLADAAGSPPRGAHKNHGQLPEAKQ